MRKIENRPPRILVTNDDGINANGLKVLERVARTLSDDVWVVAPEVNQSGAAHSLTLTRPLRVRRLDERHAAIDGTPTDCVLIALQHLIPDRPVDLVLSGVNHGHNLGEDVTYSGTIAAAMEATLFRVPAVALSQACESRQHIRWATAERWAPDLLKHLLDMPWSEDLLVNVNFPDLEPDQVKGWQVTRQGKAQDRRHPGRARRPARRALHLDRRVARNGGGRRGGHRLAAIAQGLRHRHPGPPRHDPPREP
jgi:5'-nucleotidase